MFDITRENKTGPACLDHILERTQAVKPPPEPVLHRQFRPGTVFFLPEFGNDNDFTNVLRFLI